MLALWKLLWMVPSQMGLQAVGTSLSVHWPHAFSPDPSALGSIRDLLLLQAEQPVNAKIKTPTRLFPKEGREAELRSDRIKNMSKSC